jgi:phosphoglucosamine mutase
MREHGTILGGEQSGHLIFLNYSTTGDGVLAALQFLRIMKERQCQASDLAHTLQPFPQKLINVRVEKKTPFDQVPEIQKSMKRAEDLLGSRGRVLLRYSGTESLVRLMIEGEHPHMVDDLAVEMAGVLEKNL